MPNLTASEWIAESDRLRALAVRTTSHEHAMALHDRADGCMREANRARALESDIKAHAARYRKALTDYRKAIADLRAGGDSAYRAACLDRAIKADNRAHKAAWYVPGSTPSEDLAAIGDRGAAMEAGRAAHLAILEEQRAQLASEARDERRRRSAFE